jgi:hypothetical protein
MEFVQKVDQKCAETLPYYSNVSKMAVQKYQQGLTCYDHLRKNANSQVDTVQKTSKQIKNDFIWFLSQNAESLIELFETRLSIDPASTTEKANT